MDPKDKEGGVAGPSPRGHIHHLGGHHHHRYPHHQVDPSQELDENKDQENDSDQLHRSARLQDPVPQKNLFPDRRWRPQWAQVRVFSQWWPSNYRDLDHGHGSSPEAAQGKRSASALFGPSVQTSWRYSPRRLVDIARPYWGSSATALATSMTRCFGGTSKRRKGWFLWLITVSLALTVLSGGYLMTQLQHQKELVPPATAPSSLQNDPQHRQPRPAKPVRPIQPDARRQRGRNRGQHPAGTHRTPMEETGHRDESITEGTDNFAGKPDTGKGFLDRILGRIGQEEGSGEDQIRICDLKDVANGHWVTSKDILQIPRYGQAGCLSHIWNERYLLQDSELSELFQSYRWQLDTGASTQSDDCRQPELDLVALVKVLKRSPLVMIGDKFLEQEFMSLECMLIGLQQQLVLNNQKGLVDEEMEPLSFWIESDMPPIVELRVGTGAKGSIPDSSASGAREQPTVYRKSKPGRMRLVDRISNQTLVTFIRSDVLWDADMLLGHIERHELQSLQELSKLDAGGLHPDCKIVGPVMLCEPHSVFSTGLASSSTVGSTSRPWWKWWEGKSIPDVRKDTRQKGRQEWATGSDLDHDMINLGWVGMLHDIVNEEAAMTGLEPRNSTLLISNGLLWGYDAQVDTHKIFEDGLGGEALSKAEKEALRSARKMRKKLLKQRYTLVLTNTLDYIRATWPNFQVIVQTSFKARHCEAMKTNTAQEKAVRELQNKEEALLNALTKTIVARMQSPAYTFLDTTFLRLFKVSLDDTQFCNHFMMPGPLDTLATQLLTELVRIDQPL